MRLRTDSRKVGENTLLDVDDLGLALSPTETERPCVVIEDRYGTASTIVASQLLAQHWREVIGDPTIADALVDRLVRNAHRIGLKGEWMKKTKEALT